MMGAGAEESIKKHEPIFEEVDEDEEENLLQEPSERRKKMSTVKIKMDKLEN